MTPAAVAAVRSPAAVRARCRQVFEAGLQWFAVDLGRLDAVADLVLAVTRESYPDLAIPYHSRWRHFLVDGVDQWAPLAAGIADRRERARTAADLAVLSVLLDAGAGPAWRYRDPVTGRVLARSEGLAIASLRLFPVDLDRLTTADLATGFQVTAQNPLVGLDARADLLRRLGAALRARSDLFGTPTRFGNLLDRWFGRRVALAEVFGLALEALAPIWPNGLVVDGVNLGDVAPHPAATDGLVPFHKLTQWLTYSLIEPLEWGGATVIELDGLTGLPEYRNGGLFVDLGVLSPRGLPDRPLQPREPPVVEWRAATVVLLDLLADRLRAALGRSAADLPLARLLQGGTWTAGRRIAQQLRPDGAPPLRVATDEIGRAHV